MARGQIRYKKSSRGTIELLTSPQMLTVMMAAAEKAKPYAEGLSENFIQSGDYIKAFKVTGRRRGGPKHDRAEARLQNDVAYAAAVEAHHDVLGRTADFIESSGA